MRHFNLFIYFITEINKKLHFILQNVQQILKVRNCNFNIFANGNCNIFALFFCQIKDNYYNLLKTKFSAQFI